MNDYQKNVLPYYQLTRNHITHGTIGRLHYSLDYTYNDHISYHDNDYIHVTRKGGIHDNGLIYYTGQSKYCPFDSLTNCTLWHWLNGNDELAGAVCVIIIYRQARLLRHESKKSAPVSCMQYVYDVLSAGIDGPLSIYCTSPLSEDFPVTVYESADNLAI